MSLLGILVFQMFSIGTKKVECHGQVHYNYHNKVSWLCQLLLKSRPRVQ